MSKWKKLFVQMSTLMSCAGVLINRDDVGLSKRLNYGGVIRTRISSQCKKKAWRCDSGVWSLDSLGLPESYRSRITFEKHIVEPLVAEGFDEAQVRLVTRTLRDFVIGKKAKKTKKVKEEESTSTGRKGRGRGKKAKVEEEQELELELEQETSAEEEEQEEGQEEAEDDTGVGPVKTSEVLVLGAPEVEFLREKVRLMCQKAPSADNMKNFINDNFSKKEQENFRQLAHGAGLSAAMFGRMVTGDVLANVDGAICVNHSFTVHPEMVETDYFSATDELLIHENGKGESGHINTSELTSGIFYNYTSVDVPVLNSNLMGCSEADALQVDRSQAAAVVKHLLWLLATVSPGAKKGATAPFSYADMVFVEIGEAAPCTQAEAFLSPVRSRDDLLGATYTAFVDHIVGSDRMYKRPVERRFAARGPAKILERGLGIENMPVDELAQWVYDKVRG